jgi:hypothetical protein
MIARFAKASLRADKKAARDKLPATLRTRTNSQAQ